MIKEINLANPTLSRNGHFIDGVKTELSSLRSYSVVHVRREANYAAHICQIGCNTNHTFDMVGRNSTFYL
jgi:hypothetical protein